jgi:hypothetical protein
MSIHVTWDRNTPRSAMLLAVFLVSLGACKRSHTPPPLPTFSGLPQSARQQPAKELSYRNSAGTPIAPTVIADDPAPTIAQPISNKQSGAKATTLNGDPNGLTRETLNRAVQGAMGSLAACFSSLTEDPMVSVSFEADPSGRPSLVRVNGAPSDAERCIRNVVQNIHFPSFEGKGVPVDLPLSFHRMAQPTQQGNPAGEQQAPAAAPLFLQP